MGSQKLKVSSQSGIGAKNTERMRAAISTKSAMVFELMTVTFFFVFFENLVLELELTLRTQRENACCNQYEERDGP